MAEPKIVFKVYLKDITKGGWLSSESVTVLLLQAQGELIEKHREKFAECIIPPPLVVQSLKSCDAKQMKEQIDGMKSECFEPNVEKKLFAFILSDAVRDENINIDNIREGQLYQGSHWTLLVALLSNENGNKIVHYYFYDSLYKTVQPEQKQDIYGLDLDTLTTAFGYENHDLSVVNCPRQMNTPDCSLYATKNCVMVVEQCANDQVGEALNYSPEAIEQMRRKFGKYVKKRAKEETITSVMR